MRQCLTFESRAIDPMFSGVRSTHYDGTIARKILKKDEYLTAAFAYVDANGIDVMTMRSLGAFMGVDPTAVYRHFPTKEELVNAMVDKFLQAILTSTNEKLVDPRARIVDRAMKTRVQFELHPDIGIAMLHSTGQSMAGLLLSRGVVEDLEHLGVPQTSIPIANQMLEGFVIGSCCMDFIGSPTNYSVRRLRYRAVDSPALDKVSKTEASVRKVSDNAFAEGLNALLDHIETL